VPGLDSSETGIEPGYVTKKLSEALRLEKLRPMRPRYLVQPDSTATESSSASAWAHFSTSSRSEAAVREAMRGGGFRPYEIES
jgi:hypothetical protein